MICFTYHYEYDHACHVETTLDQQFHAAIILEAHQLMLVIFGLALEIKRTAHSARKMCLIQLERGCLKYIVLPCY